MSEQPNERLIALSSPTFSLFPQMWKERRGEERRKGGDATRRKNAREMFLTLIISCFARLPD